jgi:hypothetical protein
MRTNVFATGNPAFHVAIAVHPSSWNHSDRAVYVQRDECRRYRTWAKQTRLGPASQQKPYAYLYHVYGQGNMASPCVFRE